MIRFFRKIRKQLLSENKFSKYLFYALGEIILIVIGILIALGINDWNENLKYKSQEKSLLIEIRNEILTNKKEIEKLKVGFHAAIERIECIESYLQDEIPLNSKVKSAMGLFFYFDSPFIRTTNYETLKFRGADLISSAQIRSALVELYEYRLRFLVEDSDKLSWLTLENSILPFYLKNFTPEEHDNTSVFPNDEEKIKQDNEFRAMLSFVKRHRVWDVRRYEDLLNDINLLVKKINNELDAL